MTRFNAVLAVVLWLAGPFPPSRRPPNPFIRRQTPAIPAWMGLWQKNTGAVDNYHAFVLPQMQLNQTLQNAKRRPESPGTGLQNLNSESDTTAMEPVDDYAHRTGATYMAYSHYYGGGPADVGVARWPRQVARKTSSPACPSPRVSQ